MKKINYAILVSGMALVGSAQAATIFATETYESGLGIWTANAVGSTGLYEQNVSLQPASTTHNYSSAGGTHGASLGKSGGSITSTITDLSSGGVAESLTVNFDFQLINGSSTRRGQIQYSNDGGASWFGLARIQTGSGISNSTEYSGSVTITEGSTTVTRSSWYIVSESNEFILHAIKTQNAELLKYLLKDHAWSGWHVVREHYLKLDDL